MVRTEQERNEIQNYIKGKLDQQMVNLGVVKQGSVSEFAIKWAGKYRLDCWTRSCKHCLRDIVPDETGLGITGKAYIKGNAFRLPGILYKGTYFIDTEAEGGERVYINVHNGAKTNISNKDLKDAEQVVFAEFDENLTFYYDETTSMYNILSNLMLERNFLKPSVSVPIRGFIVR